MSIASEIRRPEPQRLPADLIDAPAPVTKALAEATEAGQVLTAARTEQTAARTAIAQADEADRAEDRAAVAANKTLTGPTAGPKARKAAELAERKLAAAESVYDDAVARLLDAVSSNAEEWLEVLAKQRERTRAELAQSLEEFSRSRATLRALDGTIAMAEEFTAGGYDARIEGFPSNADILRGAAEPARIRGEVASAVRGSRRFAINESNVDRTVVELEMLAAGERPWTPSINLAGEKDGPPRDAERVVAAITGGVS